MAIELIEQATGGAPLSTDDYNAQNVNIAAQLYSIDQNTLHLTEWDTLNFPKIKKDVYIQHGGALFQVKDSDYTITGSLSNGRLYIKLTRTGNILNATLTNSAVGYSWNYITNGFYHADTTQLLPYIIYRTITPSYYKYHVDSCTDKYRITSAIQRDGLGHIGVWDMSIATGTASINKAFNEILKTIISLNPAADIPNYIIPVRCNIIDDATTFIYDLELSAGEIIIDIVGLQWTLVRDAASRFALTANFNSGINRGEIHYKYWF
jgi:hypothetical protein